MIIVLSTDGTELVARRCGNGIPVVLVHGSLGGLDSWDGVAALLADTYEVWVYARRGYAPSGPGRSDKTFADDVADVLAVAHAAGGGAHLVGASYGATVGLHAALGHPSTFRSLAVFEPPLFASGSALYPVLRSYESLLRSGDLATAARLFAEKVARAPAALLDSVEAGGGDAAEAVGCLHDLQAMAADETDVGRWRGVAIPTLLMGGAESWAPIPDTMERLANALPTAERVVLEGQSHFATHTAPEMFAAKLRKFWSEHSA